MQLSCGLLAREALEATCSYSSQRVPRHASIARVPGLATHSAMRLHMGGVRASLQRRSPLRIVNTYPEPETEKERSTLDFPQEWITPQPSRRPDIFPEFEKLETPMPKPMPGDPELPEDEEEEEKEKKEEPDKENPDEEPGEKPDAPPEE